MKKYIILLILILMCLPVSAKDKYKSKLKKVSGDKNIQKAVKLLDNPVSDDSYFIILGDNPTKKNIKIEFKDLKKYGNKYAEFEALGWTNKGRLYIYINNKNKNENVYLLSSLISGRAINVDNELSINEEIYSWALEGATWGYYLKKMPELNKLNSNLSNRENFIYQCYSKSPQDVKYIKRLVIANSAYDNYDKTSTGYSDRDLNAKINNLYDAYAEREYVTGF